MLFNQIEQLKSTLSSERAEALSQFLATGFPTKKDEEYKYTDLSEAVNKQYSLAPKQEFHITKEQLDQLHLGEEHFDFIVFVNGKFQKALSKISVENAEFLTLNNAFSSNKDLIEKYFNQIKPKNTAFTALNDALYSDGFFLFVPKNTVIEKPIHLFYISENQDENVFYTTRNLLIV